jgi:hypothetical protein
MRPLLTLVALVALSLISFYGNSQNRFWISTSSGNWNDPANWSTTSNGVGGASVPGATNTAVFNGTGGTNGTCNLDISPTVAGITMNGYSGTIDVSGFDLTTTGANTFTSGTISNSGGSASVIINASATTTFSGTVFNVPVTGSANGFLFNGSTFNNSVNLTKTDNTNNNGTGGNTFNGPVTFTIAGTGQLQLAGTNPDVFQNTLTVNLNSTGSVAAARGAAGTQFNGDITVNFNSTGSFSTGANGGTSTLGAGRVVTVGTIGALGAGNLSLGRITQADATALTLTLSGNENATLTLGPASTFNGTVTASAPELILNSSTFFNTTSLTQTSNSNTSNWRGGNVFWGQLTVTNTGNADIEMGSTSGDAGDVFHGNATFNDLGGGRIRIGTSTAGNIFNGDAVFNSSGATDLNNRIQVSRFSGASTTFNGSATFVNNGNSSDIHISFDAGTLTTFNGPLTLVSATTAAGNFYVGNEGNVVINGDIDISSSCSDQIELSAGTGTVTFGNGTLTVSSFTAGRLTFANFTQTGTAITNMTLTGTSILELGPSSVFNSDFTGIAPRLILDGCTYNGTTYLEKTGSTLDNSDGNNVFNGPTTIVNSAVNSIRTGVLGIDTFNGDLTLINRGAASIQLSYQAAGSVYNGNISLESTSGTGIFFGSNGGTSTLAAGNTLTIGPGGFTTGELAFRQFTQTGNTSQSLSLSGTALLRLGPSSAFDGPVNFVSPQVLLSGCVYNNTAIIEKNGATDNSGAGGNTFNGTATLINSGSGYLLTGSTTGDTFNDISITNSGSSTTYLAHNAASSFNGNIVVNCTNGNGIYFSAAAGSTTLADGKTITVGPSGFTTGDLRLQKFTQLGNTAQNLALTGTGELRIGPTSIFNGSVNFIAPQILLNGATFNNTAYFEKTGATDNASTGGNIFNGATTITNSGSAYFLLANTSADIFNNSLTVTNTGSSYIYVAHNSPGNQFNGNISVNSSGSSLGVVFGNGTSSSSTLAATYTVAVGTTFTTGELRLRRFTQVGNTAQNLVLTGTALLRVGPSSEFNGTVNFVARRLALDGCTFNNTTYLEKSGPTNDDSAGNNFFNASTTLVNSGSGWIRTAISSAAPDTFNADLTVLNSGSSQIRLSEAATNSVYNGNIVVNSTSGTGIYFGVNGGGTTLADGRTISVGASGFSSGTLSLAYFTQAGTSPQSLDLSGTALLQIGTMSTFNGNVDFRSPQITLQRCTFNGTAYFEKEGATNNASFGGNTFNGLTTIVNSGSGYFRLSNDNTVSNNGDTFNADVVFTATSSGALQPAYNRTSSFAGNITINSATAITFGSGAGTTQMTGSSAQTISKGVGSANPVIQRLVMNKPAQSLTLNTPVDIGSSATFTSGIINTSNTNILTFISGSSANGANNTSYVDGPVLKTGNQLFTFPVGDGGFYRAISISAPTGTTSQFRAQYFLSPQALGTSMDASFATLSACEYWLLDRINGTSSVSVTLSWDETICSNYTMGSPSDLRVARWSGASWVSHGNGGTTVAGTTGTIVSSGAVTAFSPFTLASVTLLNPLPISLSKFWAEPADNTVAVRWITLTEKNNAYFTLERSADAFNYEYLTRYEGAGTTNEKQEYTYIDEAPLGGLSYYRLTQVDFDGTSTSWLTSVHRDGTGFAFEVHPNPTQGILKLNAAANITVTNQLNQILLSAENVWTVDLSSLPAGVYIVRNQRGQVVKVVKH